ncbi:MAG: chorismate synthase [Clostridia bacterium]|nr:chorismate synthase [Clostridia bacterium]
MKNTFGHSVAVTIFGESHGQAIGAVLDGMAPGIDVDESFIAAQMELRKPKGRISTSRHEEDAVQILSGVFEGKTTGTPICMTIQNNNTRSKDYSATRNFARPGHADYTANCKYHGYEDYRGGGHFSGRITSGIVAAGAIAIAALRQKGIYIGTHIKKCAGISDRSFGDLNSDIAQLSNMEFAVLDNDAAQRMNSAIVAAAGEGDSVGGILETAITGLPAGVGEPWFDTFESILSHILFSIPAIKGVQFGAGFALADMRGSEANDSFRMAGDKVVTVTNNNGGINGGITNGMPVLFSCVVKPTASIYKEQQTVDFINNEDADFIIKGRHDPAIVHRARVVVDSVAALAVCDMLAMRYGTDYLRGDGK